MFKKTAALVLMSVVAPAAFADFTVTLEHNGSCPLTRVVATESSDEGVTRVTFDIKKLVVASSVRPSGLTGCGGRCGKHITFTAALAPEYRRCTAHGEQSLDGQLANVEVRLSNGQLIIDAFAAQMMNINNASTYNN